MTAEQIADLRAEFIASSWLEDGLTTGDILFRSLGNFRRRSHLDVEYISEQEIGRYKGYVIGSNRSGIYDYLPEQLFHLPSSASINTLKKKVDEIRLQREKEQQSRMFFLPLEQEFFLNRLDLTQLEQRAFELDPECGLLKQLQDFWQIPDGISKNIVVELLAILPIVSEDRGDMTVVGKVMSVVLNMPVRVKSESGKKQLLASESRLAGSQLGIDTILGGEMDSYQSDLVVEVELPDQAALEESLADESFDILVNWLAGWFIPAEYDYCVALKVDPTSSLFRLGDVDVIASRLAYAVI